jgi:hypothetical protein
VLQSCRLALLLVAVLTISGSTKQFCWLAVKSVPFDLDIGIQLEHMETLYTKGLRF